MLTYQCPLLHFGEVVTSNFVSGAVFDSHFLLFDAFSDEKILHINVTIFFILLFPFPLHEDGALVILMYNILVYIEALSP